MIDATTIIVALITLLIGGGTGGFIVAWRKDVRQIPLDEAATRKAKVEVTLMIEELAERAVAKAKKQLQEQEEEAQRKLARVQADSQREIKIVKQKADKEIDKLHKRINQLEVAMKDSGLIVPPWEGENA